MAIASAFASACNLHNEGVTPPEGAISYPQALALSREVDDATNPDGPDFLYLANTNYDLRYNAGSVHAYDLKKLAEALRVNRCRTMDERMVAGGSIELPDNTTYATPDASTPLDVDGGLDGGQVVEVGGLDAGIDAGGGIVLPADYGARSAYGDRRGVLCDGRDPVGDGRTQLPGAEPGIAATPDCCWGTASELAAVRSSSYRIDSYASAVAVSPDNKRLYVPVQSNSRLLYFDLFQPGVLDCGGVGRCQRGPGLKSPDDSPDVAFPRQIANMAVGRLSELVGAENAGDDPVYLATSHELGGFGLFLDRGQGPVLEDAITGLENRPTSLTVDPRKRMIYVTANQQPYFARLGVRIANTPDFAGREPAPRELVVQSSQVFVNNVAQTADLRDIRVDPTDPNRLYVLIRGSQQSVAFMDLEPAETTYRARLVDAVRVGDGPSKLLLMQQDGRQFLLASSYDDKVIFVIDTATRKVDRVIRNLSGPFQMVHDPVRRLIFVTDFRVSVLRVVDVAGLTQADQPPPRIVATLGDPEFEGAVN